MPARQDDGAASGPGPPEPRWSRTVGVEGFIANLKREMLMKRLWAAAAVATSMLALTATSASAAVVCNAAGECWHTDRHYHYAPEVGAVYHPDHWYFHQKWDQNHQFRDYHEGRGFYRNG